MPPVYEYVCENGHDFERYLFFSEYKFPQVCECGAPSRKKISRPNIFVQQDVCYDSPVDGRPITSMKARQEDLARNNCRPYDPEMKTDYHSRIRDSEMKLESAVEKTIEAEIEKMPARKREKLEQELKSGVEAVPERITPPQTSFRS
jgi:hypothetical protein